MKKPVCMFVFAFFVAAFPAGAEEAAAPGGMDPKLMEKMKAQTQPGEAQKKLEQFAGKWKYTAQFWMAPEDKPQTMEGEAVNEMIYGGRFLKQTVTGTWMGEPWEGLGYTGYDNMRRQYQTVWIDGMSTGLMWSEGNYDDATKTLSQGGTMSCPMTGDTHQKMRSEWKSIDDGHSVYSSYTTDKDGKEFKGMEIHYTRA